MTRIGIIELTAFAFLCSAQLAGAADAPPVKKDVASEPHWYDAVAGKKYFSLEGSSAQLSLAEDGLSLDIAAPDGSTKDKLYIYINDDLGSIYDAADKNDAIGVFRQDDSGIRAEYADGHSETL